MSDTTSIEWCDSTFNPWMGCTKISPACDHCYAERDTARFGRVQWGAGAPRVRTSDANWRKPRQWNERPFYACGVCGWRGEGTDLHWAYSCPAPNCDGRPEPARRRVFCASLADVFDNQVDPQWRIDLLKLIAITPRLDWLLLTKRIGNAERLLDEALDALSHGLTRWDDAPWPNVWLGATICNQTEADRDVPKLLATPAAVRFVSIEPMLGSIDIAWALSYPIEIAAGFLRRGYFSPGLETLRRLDWVIAGGESGPHARPMHPDWVRSLRDQCAAAGVPFLFKQWGEFRHRAAAEDTRNDAPESLLYVPEHGSTYARVGKKKAGRLLDGVEHNAFPPSPAARAAT